MEGIVVQALAEGQARFRRYRPHCDVVMPNHVRLPVTPLVRTSQWLGPRKGYTGHRANQIPGRRGVPIWQGQSYHHLVGDAEGFRRAQHYMEFHPVGAG
jgi:hypothetical protein